MSKIDTETARKWLLKKGWKVFYNQGEGLFCIGDDQLYELEKAVNKQLEIELKEERKA